MTVAYFRPILAICVLCLFAPISQAQNRDGLDRTYGNQGLSTLPFSNLSRSVDAIVLQPDNKVISIADELVIRFREGGDLDSSFATNGVFSHNSISAPISARISAVKLQTDQKIILAGSYDYSVFYVTRLKPNGSLDSSFGINGTARHYFPDILQGSINSMALQPDGRIVLAGGERHDIILTRLLTDGKIDSSFGTNGLVKTNGGPYGGMAKALAIMPDGRIVAGGTRDGYVVALRYLPNGGMDTSFGHTGLVQPAVIPYFSACTDLKLTPAGKIILSGNSYLACILPNGTMDVSFGQNGIFKQPSPGIFIRSLGLLPDGALIGGGDDNDYTQFAMIKVKADGSSVDSSFGSNGIRFTDVTHFPDRIHAIAIQSDGKIVAGGYAGNNQWNQERDLCLARYPANASLDVTRPINELKGVRLYPNPATDHFTIAFDKQPSGAGYIYIVSADGRVRSKTPITEQKTTVNLSPDMPSGYYTIQVSLNDKTSSFHLLKR